MNKCECGREAIHQCGFTSNEVCTTWVCEICWHIHPTVGGMKRLTPEREKYLKDFDHKFCVDEIKELLFEISELRAEKMGELLGMEHRLGTLLETCRHNRDAAFEVARCALNDKNEAIKNLWQEIHKWKPYLHFCEEWDGLLIDKGDAEYTACHCME